jgi:LPXTG-site transpeptidase (sortase) family protein
VPLEGDIVAWYTFSRRPGTGGNAVYCAHATWNGEAVFSRLPELQPGEKFSFINDNGARLTYNVIDVQAVDATAVALHVWFAPTDYDAATLLTCDDPWYADAAAPGGASNYVVRGSLVEVKTAD